MTNTIETKKGIVKIINTAKKRFLFVPERFSGKNLKNIQPLLKAV